MFRTQKRSLYLAILAACLLLVLSFGAASAHELEPLAASPAPGDALQESPSEVRLTFSEELSEEGSSLVVLDAQGRQVDLGGGGVDLNDPDHSALVVALPTLGEGVYLVKWEITLTDGDSTQGSYYFGIGNVTVPQPEPEVVEDAVVDETEPAPGSSTLVWVGVVAALVILSIVIFFFVNRSRS